MRRTWGVVAAGLLVLLPGCEPASEEARPPGDASRGEAVDRPAERRIPVAIEGYEEILRFVLYRTPPGFPIPFSSYIPDDMVAETPASPAPAPVTAQVAFVAAFGGVRNEAAAVRVLVPGAGATESDAVALLRELASELGTELIDAPPEERFEWAVRQYRSVAEPFRADVTEGLMAVGRREGRYFAVAIHYPAEFGDGFGPRARQILREWRWEDTGEPLERLHGPRDGWL